MYHIKNTFLLYSLLFEGMFAGDMIRVNAVAKIKHHVFRSIQIVIFGLLAAQFLAQNAKAQSSSFAFRCTSTSHLFPVVFEPYDPLAELPNKANPINPSLFVRHNEKTVTKTHKFHILAANSADFSVFACGFAPLDNSVYDNVPFRFVQFSARRKYYIKFDWCSQSFLKESTLGFDLTASLRGYQMALYENETAVSGENTVYVSNGEELFSALENATGGEKILLTGGDYGNLNLFSNQSDFVKFPENVTIQSADPANAAKFSGLDLRGVENLTFESVIFDYEAEEGAPIWVSPFSVSDSSNISIRNSLFDGDLASGLGEHDNGYATGKGLTVRDSNGIDISGNEFKEFHRGAVFNNVDDILVSNNEMYDLRSDGMDFAEVKNVVIEKNHFHDFKVSEGSDDHRDMIQFWTTGTDEPSENIVIRENILDSGTGSWTQSIFMRNEEVDYDRAGEEMFYNNITIENNVILNGHSAGISVGQTTGLNINNNTILHNKETWDNGLVSVPTIRVHEDSVSVNVTNNIVPWLNETSAASHTYEDNLIIQRDDPQGENYYGDIFVNGLADSDADLSDLQVLSGGAADGYGSSLTSTTESPDEVTGHISNVPGTGISSLSVTFDANNISGPNGPVDLNGATITWDFGDGETGTGQNVVHTYQNGGKYEATATVIFPNEETLQLKKSIEPQSPLALKLSMDGQISDSSDTPNDVSVTSEVELTDGSDGGAIRLNGGTVTVAGSPELVNNSEYTFAFDLKQDGGATEKTRLVTFSNSFTIFADDDGFIIAAVTDKGTTWLNATDIGVSDGNWHKVALMFSGQTGELTLFLDGVAVATETGLQGAVQIGSQNTSLILGEPWGGTAFDGLLDNITFLKGAIDPEHVGDLDDPNTPVSSDEVPTPPPADQMQQDQGAYDSNTMQEITVSAEEDITIGSSESDYFISTSEDDTLKGLGGNDYVDLGDGDDYYNGGDGDDMVLGGAGNDTFLGLAGFDTAYGGDGNDVLRANRAFGEAGNDTLSGDEENTDDYLDGGDGDDKIHASSGNNQLFGGAGNDKIGAGDGDDFADGGSGNDVIRTGGGDDTLLGGDGDDVLAAYAGNDFLDGGSGADMLIGGEGDDIFVFDANDSKILGGTGNDTLKIVATNQDAVMLTDSMITGIEQVDLDNDGADLLVLNHKQIGRSDTNSLQIDGEKGDIVALQDHAVFQGMKEIGDDFYFELVSHRFGEEHTFLADADLTLVDRNGDILIGGENLLAVSDSGETAQEIFDGVWDMAFV